jgi:hypothetical protein
MRNAGLRLCAELGTWWILLFALYVIFISTLSPLELLVGASASGVAAAAGCAVHRTAAPTAGPGRHWAAAVWAWPGTLLTETWQLARLTLAALFGRVERGRFTQLRLRPGVGPAWAGGMLSATPGSCVVEVDEGHGQPGSPAVLTVHALYRSRSRLESVLTEDPTGDDGGGAG